MKIRPNDNFVSSHRTGSISGYESWQIQKILGFAPNVEDDPDKVVHSWRFTVDGYDAAIWDYKGSHHIKRWSIYDPHNILGNLFVIDNPNRG
jgi:hypothetical protein